MSGHEAQSESWYAINRNEDEAENNRPYPRVALMYCCQMKISGISHELAQVLNTITYIWSYDCKIEDPSNQPPINTWILQGLSRIFAEL